MRYVNDYLYDKISVLIPRKGTLDNLFIVKEPFWTIDTLFWTKIDEEIIDPRFLYFSLLIRNLAGKNVGTAVPSLTIKVLNEVDLLMPPLPTQKAIADTLSCLDAKIEVNNKIIKNLEKQAQAIFKSWFVDFEPFQDGKFIESELGLIPAGWRVGRLEEIIKITSGKRPNARQEKKDGIFRYPLLGASGIMGYTSEFLYNENIIVIGRVGTHGIVQEIGDASWPSDNTLVIRSKRYGFVASVLRSIDYGALNRGSTQPLITQTDIKNTKVVIPAMRIIDKLEDIYSAFFNKRRIVNIQNSTLAALRDTLLPKLMSGEIEVPVE